MDAWRIISSVGDGFVLLCSSARVVQAGLVSDDDERGEDELTVDLLLVERLSVHNNYPPPCLDSLHDIFRCVPNFPANICYTSASF